MARRKGGRMGKKTRGEGGAEKRWEGSRGGESVT